MGSIRDRLKEIADSGSTTPISAQKAYKPAGTMNPGRLYSGKKEEEEGLDTASARARQLAQARRAAMERANARAQEIREKRTVRDLGTGSAREERLQTSQQAAASRLHAENRRANAGFTTFARGNAVTQTSEMDTGRALAEGLNRSGMDMQTRGEAAAESQRRASELQKQLTNQEKVLQNVYDAYMKAPSEELYNGYQNLYKRYENTKQAYALYAEKYQKDAQGYREAEKFYALMQQEAEKQQRKQDAEMGVETGEDGKRRIVDFEKYNAAAGINPETLYTGADARAADEALEPYAKQLEYWQRNGTKERKTQQAVQNSMNALKDAYIDNPQATTAQRDKARQLLAQMDALENIGNADALTYTAAQLPLGMEGQIRGVTSLAGTAIGDLATGGKTSEDFKALTDFLAANPAYEKLVFESGTAADFVARKAGVSPASVKAYREANVNAYNTQKVSDYYEGVSDTYKETAGRMAYSVGQQLPSMLLTMGGGEMIGSISQRAATGAITEAAAKAQMAAVEALSKSISVGLMSVGAAGNTLTERANESGYSLANYAYAAATGATEAATEYMLGTTGDVASYQLKVRGVRELFQNALEEGIEEMLGYPIESAADWLFASSKSVDEWVDKITKNSVLDKMSVKEWLQSGIEGFAVGGLMGVSGLVLNSDSGDYDSTGFDRKIKGYAGRESVDYFADMADMEQLNARYEQLRAVYGTQGTDPDTRKMARINNQYISRVGYTAMRAYMEKNGIDMTPAREKLVPAEQKKSASGTETQKGAVYTAQEEDGIGPQTDGSTAVERPNEVVDSEGNYIRIENPSANTKSGVTVQDGVTAGAEGLSDYRISESPPAVNANPNTENDGVMLTTAEEPEAPVKLRSDTDVNLTTYAQDLNAKRAAALRRRVADAEAELASPAELGVVQGETETRNRIVPESIAARDADLQEAREILNGAGYTDTGFVTGQIERYGGTDHYALTKDGKALIQADSVWYTPQELAQTFVQQYGEKKGAKGNEKEQVSLYDRNAGRRGTEPGRKRAERVSETERLRGGTREHREAADQRRRAAAGQPEISPAEAGVPYGAENSRCQIQPESTWDAEQQAAAEYAYSKGARTVVYLIGDMQVEYEGATEIIEGAWDAQTRTLYVRADSLSRSVSETVEHEAAHAMITQENVERFMTLVKQKKTAAWSALYAAYEKRYRSFTEGMTAKEKGLYIWEEILADAYSETNRYGTRAGTFAAQADEAMEGAGEVQAGERGRKFSFGKLKDADVRAQAEEMDFDAEARYNEQTNEGGASYGREMGDDTRGRVSAQMPGKQGAAGAGQYRTAEADVPEEGRAAGNAGQNVLRSDSEGRRLTAEQAQRLQGTAITDETGAPLAVYHFTPETEFETFEKGDIGFHFGTKGQAMQRGKDMKAENGRMFRAYLNIKNPYHVRLDLNTWWPYHIGLYMYCEGVLTDAQWEEIQSLDGRGYDTPGAKRLREMLSEKGIDGFVYPNMVEGSGDSYIALYDEQIVRSDILPVKTRFSLDEPVERTKDLIAVHNKDWSVIRDAALNWGGLPSPSVAIVDAQEGHTKYGDTSVVFPRATIDPEADPRNKVYSGDAWTPTKDNAIVEREVNYEARRAFDENIKKLSSQFADGVFQGRSTLGKIGLENETRLEPQEIADKLANYPEVQAAYLQSEGKSLEPVYRNKQFDRFFSNAAIRRYLDTVGEQEVARLNVKLAIGERLTAEDMKPAEQAIREVYAEEHANFLNRRPESKEKRIDYYMENNVFQNRVEDFIRNTQEFYESGGSAGEIDKEATASKMMEMIAPDGSWDDVLRTVKDWVQPQLNGLLGERGIYNGEDPVTDSGRRSFAQTHWDYTAENIVKAMNMAAAKGANMYGVTPRTLAATATREYRNVDEMHADEARLRTVSEEEHEKALSDLGIYLERVTDDLLRTTKHKFDNTFDEEQNLSRIIAEAAKGKKTAAAVKAAFRKEGYAISDGHAKSILALIDRAANIPTGYYEAKAQRVVPLSEAAAIIVPTSAPAEEVAAVKAATGANIIRYEAGNDVQRIEIVNGLDGVKFSASETTADPVPEYLHEMDAALRESSAVNYTPGTLETLLEKKGLTAEEIEASGIMDIAEDALHQTGRPVGTIDAEALKEYVRIKMNAYRKYTETGIHPATETEMRNAELKARRKLRSELLGLFPVQQQNRAEVSQALEDFANWYMSGGERIDKDALWSHTMALFDTLWKSAREMDESGTEVYGPAATMMRGMKLDVPESVRADFGDDWGDARRALFGVGIYTTKKGGLPLDSAYAELSAVHPGFFDEHELDGKAQLEKILEIAQEARPKAMTLEETARRNGVDVNAMMSEYLMGTTVAVGDYMTALGNMRESWKTGVPTGMSIDDYLEYRDRSAREDAQARAKTIARENFRATPAMDRLGIRIDNSVTDYGQAMALKELNRARRQAEQKAQKEAERRGATRAERQAARAIARGDMRLTDYRFGGQLKQETVKALSELYAAVESFNADAIAAHKRGVKEQLREQMGKLIGKQLPRKKLGMAAMNYMTPKRIMAELFGDAGGKQVYDEVFRSVARNGGEMIRWVQGQKDKVKRFEGADGKARKLSAGESRIVQMMMEGRGARDSAAKLHEGVRDNILNAAADIYGKLRALNENKRSYKKAAQAAMDDARAEYGLNADELRLAYQASRMNEAETLVKELGLDAVKLQNAVNTYREMFDGYYDAINDFLVVHGYEPIGFVKGYTPHMQSEESLGALTKALQLLGGTEDVSSLPVDIAGLTQDFKPGKKYDPYFLQRTGVLSSYDIQAAFDSYLDYLGQVFFRTDDIMRVRALSSYIRENYAPESLRDILDWDASLGEMPAEVKRDWLEEQGAIARDSQMTDEEVNEKFDEYREQITEDAAKNSQYGNLVMWLDNYANILAGKQSAADRGNEQLLGRRTANIANKMTGMTGAALVGANMSSVLNQTSQLAFILGENRTSSVVKALGDMMTRRTRGWDVQSDFLAGKDGVDLLAKDAKGMLDESLFSILTLSDRLVATLAVRTRYIEEIRKGADAETAMNRADDWARDMMGSRMKGERPLAFESKRPLVRAVNMFQTEVLNSWEHVALDLPQEIRDIERTRGRKKAALAAANLIIKTLISAFVMNRLADELYGGTPAMFDVIGLSGLFVASGQGMTENDWIRRVIDNGLENLGAERIFGTARGEDKDFNWKAAREDTFYNITNDLPLVRNVAGLLGWGDETLPTMQLDELLDYVRDMIAGATAGNLRGVTDSAVGLLSNVIPGGRQLQKTYQGARIMAEGGRYKGKNDSLQLMYPVDATVTDWVKALLFGRAGVNAEGEYWASGEKALSTGQTELYREMVGKGADGQEVYSVILDWRAAANDKELNSAERGKREREALKQADLTDGEKLEMYRGLANADSRSEDFRKIMDTGVSFNRTMELYDAYKALYDREDMTAGEKATEFAVWLDGQDYDTAQKTEIRDVLKYYSMVPAEAGRYDKLTDAGLGVEAAERMTKALAALEPEEGKENVSVRQQYRAVLDSDLSDGDKAAAIGTLMDSTDEYTEKGELSQWGKFKKVLDSGLTLEDWYDMYTEEQLDNFCRYMDEGISGEAAMQTAEALDELKDQYEGTDENPKDIEKWRAIALQPYDEFTKSIVLEKMMDEGAYAKYRGARDAGMSTWQYVDFKDQVSYLEADKDANGKTIRNSLKNKVVALIDSMDISGEAKDYLYLNIQKYAKSGLGSTPWH